MIIFLALVHLALYLMLVLLMLRLVLDWVESFARNWRPRGIVLVVASLVYRLTDPPMRLMRRLIPPLRLGNVSLDMGFLVLIVVLGLLRSLVNGLISSLG